ncbi:MAG: 4-hydroxy-3-methylbut-2-enyl diphosphate reductase [Oscillospiraceae bacterium]|nr:4-hydroxy-3-methylbut-2-enyl diphosphate reductase [Oscillospiraceae bacterium]
MIHIAKTAGFCFGVNRAVEMVTSLAESGERVFTLGPIIHNAHAVDDLRRKGVTIVDNPREADGGILVIRSHGVPQAIYNEIKTLGMRFADATCPFVSKIHQIVSEASQNGDVILIAGDPDHPEVLGISGHCFGEYHVFCDEDQLESLFKNHPNLETKAISVVAQTTYNTKLWKTSVKNIKKVCTNAKIFDTICNATHQRQSEAAELARKCGLMVVIGDKQSSNTQKLWSMCSVVTPTRQVESAGDLKAEWFAGAADIGVTAGASTPAGIIKEVYRFMAEIMNNNEENFGAMLEESLRVSNTTGKVVHGTVVGIAPNEIYVDVGRKQSGIVVLEELTDDPTKTADQVVSIGQELDLMILRTNDQEGYIYCSLRVLDAAKAWDEIVNAAPKIVNTRRRRDDDDVVTAADDDAEKEAEAAETAAKAAGETPPVGDGVPDAPQTPDVPQETAPVGEGSSLPQSSDVPHETPDVPQTPAAPAEEEPPKEDVVFEGFVTEIIKGGVIVSYKGVKVFIPASQATARRDDPLEELLNKKTGFVILEVNPGRRRAVGSIRAVLNKERREEKKAFWDSIEEGKAYTGKVKSMTDFGVFVDLGPVDGLVHISELSWNRVRHPSEVVNVGDVLEVYVKRIDRAKNKISLGYKKTEDNPWEILRVKYPVGTIIEAPIVGTTTFGAFVNIMPGIDGLIHVSQLSTVRVAVPTDIVKVGDVVQAMITEIDFDRRRISLSIRALLEPEDEALFEEAPVDETPVEEAPAEEAPVEEAQVEESPAEEAPVEEIPVEETPLEEAEQQPAQETADAGE